MTIKYAEDRTIIAKGQLSNVRVLLGLAPALHARGGVTQAIVLGVFRLLDFVWLTQIGPHLASIFCSGFCVFVYTPRLF